VAAPASFSGCFTGGLIFAGFVGEASYVLTLVDGAAGFRVRRRRGIGRRAMLAGCQMNPGPKMFGIARLLSALPLKAPRPAATAMPHASSAKTKMPMMSPVRRPPRFAVSGRGT